ncbi:MAG: hypothetical protein QNJ40_09190 [Xanthomonadales bacterium]|nr:hypothetical protein [Xanthomonadales bacterium]
MNQQKIEQAGTGSIERTGTGYIEQSGTGNIEQAGTGSIERSGTGGIERTGTGRVSRALVAFAAFAISFSAFATEMYFTDLGGLSIAKSKGAVNVSWHYSDGDVQKLIVGQGKLSKNFGQVDLHEVDFRAVDKVVNDGTSNDKVVNDGTGSDKVVNDGTSNSKPGRGTVIVADEGFVESDVGANRDALNVVNDGTSNNAPNRTDEHCDRRNTNFRCLKVVNDGTSNDKAMRHWGKMELIFTEYGVEVVAVRESEKGEWETIVFDLQDNTNFNESIVFVDSE